MRVAYLPVLVLVLVPLGSPLARVSSAAERASKLLAVPRAAEVTLDGDLSDWDLSATLESAYEPALAPRFSARFAAMYDESALYLSARMVDESPLRNRFDPHVNAQEAWRGDCLQVRLNTDPTMALPLRANEYDARRGDASSTDPRIVHVTMWWFTDRSEPCLTIDYGFDFHGRKLLVGRDAPVAFRVDQDGGGYTLEARLPWALLAAQPGQRTPHPGDRVALTLQPLWSDAAGDRLVLNYNEVETAKGFHFQSAAGWGVLEFSPTGNLVPAARVTQPTAMAEPLEIRLPIADSDAVQLSAAVWSPEGSLRRTLPSVAGLKPDSEHAVLRWDGLDDDGQPLPPGEYVVKFLTHHGVGERWVTSLHCAGVPPWKTDDGTGAWGGDHGVPVAAASGGGRVFLAWGFSEAGFTTIAVDEQLTPEGRPRKYWGSGSVLEIGLGTVAAATDGERVFLGQDGKRWGDRHGGDAPNRAGVILWNARTGRAENFPFGKRILEVSHWQGHVTEGDQDAMNLAGLAVDRQRLYLSLHHDGKVVAYDWTSGQQLREYALARPRGLAVEPGGTLAVVSGSGVVRLDPDSGTTTELASGFSDPFGIAVDAEGTIYVSDRGEMMCVRVLAADGQPVRTIGRPGGRPLLGRFDPQGMLKPHGIAVDSAGKLWVTESDNTPRRVSVWDARSGTLLADLLGPGHYAINGAVDLARPTWANTHHTLFEVDYETGRTKTLATLLRPRGLQFGTDGDANPIFFRHVGGRTYLVHCGREVTVIFLFDETTLSGQPVAAITARTAAALAGIHPDRFPPEQRDLAQEKLGDDGQLHNWTDRNSDRLIQLDEIIAERTGAAGGGLWGLYWGVHVDEQLTIWAASAYHTGHIWRIPVQEFLADGTPVYPPPRQHVPLFSTEYRDAIGGVLPAGDGESLYVIEQAGGDGVGGGSKMAVSRYTLDGRRLWAYRKTWTGFALDAPLFRPGYVIGAMKFCGLSKLDRPDGPIELVMVNGYHGQFNILTSDGLWVAALASDNRFSPHMSEHTYYVENFSGFFFRNGDNGRYYYLAGETDTRIMEITGLESIRTGSTTLVLSEADVARARESAARRSDSSGERPALVIRRASPTVDGVLGEWQLDETAALDGGGGRGARLGLARDDDHLYLAFDVVDDSPMKNAGSDYALLFKSGDTCELMLGTDPAADPRRPVAAPGDLRLLLTEMDGRPVVVLYEPVLRAGQERAERVFSSPTGNETFARVRVVAEAQVAIQRGDVGYRLEASVPISALGFQWNSDVRVLRGDMGVLFSTPGGNAVGRRAYYFNQETQITQDLPSEVRLQPANWGTLRVE